MSYRDRDVYHARKRAGRCVDCDGKKLPEWTGVRCPECSESSSLASARHGRTAKGKATKRRYFTKPAAMAANNANQRRYALARKVRGQCLDCPLPCLEDSVFCHVHRESHRAAGRDYARRRREALRAGTPIEIKRRSSPARPAASPIRPERPQPPIVVAAEPRPWERVIRAARHYDAFTTAEICDHLGVSEDAKDRNTMSAMVRRLVGRGLMERVRGGIGDNHTTYRITTDGRRAM